MATLHELEQRQVLVKIQVRLPRGAFYERRFYALPAFATWLRGDVMEATPFDPTSLPPRQQAGALLQQFISGKPMNVGKMFKRMRPAADDVYELCTADLRIFGWFPEVNTFIAVAGDFMERTHAHNLYAGYRDQVVRVRDQIDLDEPKWSRGASPDDVITF